MLFTFILFAILGFCTFAPPQGNARLVLMIVFIVMMVIWIAVGVTAVDLPKWAR